MIRKHWPPAGRVLLASLLALVACAGVSAAPDAKAVAVSYRVSVAGQGKESLHVVGDIRNVSGERVRLTFPSWSPGIYRYRLLSDSISNLTATDDKGGKLEAKRLGPDSDTWEVRKGAGDSLRIEYDVDASGNNKQNDKNFVSESLAVIRGASTFFYVEGNLERPVTVTVAAPAGWKTVSSLGPGARPGELTAADYYELIDSPIMAGDFGVETVAAGPVSFVIAVDSRLGISPGELAQTVRRLGQSQIEMFGSAPFKTYTLLIHMIPLSSAPIFRGGMEAVEHQKGTLISVTPQRARALRRMPDVGPGFAPIIAHEIFHSWNGKLISPAELTRPDLAKAPRSPNIWFIEGVTKYYELLTLRRAGLLTDPELYASLATLVKEGNVRKSLSRESTQAAQGLSQPLYYKGALVALALDVQIRTRSANAQSLDDVIRDLYAEGRAPRPYTAQTLQKAIERRTGASLGDFYQKYIDGEEVLEVNEYFRQAGLEVAVVKDVIPQDIGIYFNGDTGRIVGLATDAAGYEAGLRLEDEILSVNGENIKARPFPEFFAEHRTGRTYTFVIKRGGQELTVAAKIKPVDRVTASVSEIQNPTEQQLKLRNGLFKGAARLSLTRPTAAPLLPPRAWSSAR